ncbi:CHRD domain-containing protein [Alteromonas sp. CYL-A6]|uniref:CHRD domain-containing protein n=1 Tax=Alteromonas nitratireducens TaxID=3390813 RepID=UPI0034B18BC5
MKRIRVLLAALIVPQLLSGCWLDDDDNDSNVENREPLPQVPEYANVRVIHASSDAPTVNITANDAILNGLEMVDYQVSSGRFEVETGTYDIGVIANLPGDDAEVLQADVTLEADTNYDIFAVGNVGDESLMLLPVTSAETSVEAGNVQVQIVHAASMAPTVDIYVTAPDAVLEDEQPLVTAAFTDATGLLQVPAGDYRIRITPAGDTTVVFDSGTVPLPDGADLLVAATNNTGTGDSPVTLLVADGTSATKLWDVNATADIRVVHGISDAPAVDVIANNAVTLVDGIAFPSATGYVSVAPDDYVIDVVADADNSIVAIDDAPVTLAQGVSYTAIANNTLSAPELDLLTDNPRRVATEARVRIIHASPAAGPVDIYVTADGEIDAVDPAFANVDYMTGELAETGYVGLAAGDYVVTVTPTGTKTAAIETGVLSLDAGNIYTAIAVNGEMEGDLPGLILLDDLAPPPPAFMADMTYNVSLSGSQEVPAVDTMSSATAIVEIDTDLPAFKVTLDVSDVMGASAAHVHDGDIGFNGDVAFALTDMGDGTFMLDETALTAELLEDLQNGEWYLNVHTDANPSGEVRGQIVPDTTAVVTFPISGTQSVPAVDTMAMGYGYALFDTTTNSVMLTAVTMDLETATAAHIHSGYAGETGGVVAPLTESMTVAGTWMTDGYLMLDEATATQLLSGGHYTNFHTPANPNGEIRGQITPANIEVYGIMADGDQEVPAVSTSAYGYGAFTLNTTSGDLRGVMTVVDIMPTAAHVHAGEAGVNGDVVFALTDNGDGTWSVPDGVMLTADQMMTMQNAGYYTNFHTDANPSGEIRGQITVGFE